MARWPGLDGRLAAAVLALLAASSWELFALLFAGGRWGGLGPALLLQLPVVAALAVLAHRAFRPRPPPPGSERGPWSHELFQETQALSHTGSWRWSVRDDVVEWSTELYRIYGIEPSTPVDYRTFLNAIHPEDRLRVHTAVQEALEETRPFTYEERVVRPDGNVRYVLGRGRVLEDAGEKWMVGVCMDVTERVESQRALRRKEEQLARAQQMEAIGRMAAGVAHDFNNLLTAIKGFADLTLDAGDLPARHRVSLEEVSATAEQAGSMVRRLLTLGRKTRPDPQSLDVDDRLREMRRKLESLCGGKIALDLDLAGGLLPVQVDPGQFEQVVINLVVNARDASPDGARVRVRTRPGATAGTVRVEIQDHGEGIPAEVAPRVFEPFFTTKGRGGTGLGLATAYAIVEAHGGKIWFEDRREGGTVFSFELPCAGADQVGRASAGAS